MQIYRLISGSTQNIAEFEKDVAALLEDGYALEGPLVATPGVTGTHLFQALILDEYLLEDLDDEEDDDTTSDTDE